VGRAGNARIVISHGLFALPCQCGIGEVQAGGNKISEIVFNCLLVLSGRGCNFRFKDNAVGINFIPVVEHAAGRLGGPVSDTGFWINRHERLCGLFIGLNNAQGLIARIDQFDGPYDNTLKRVPALLCEAGSAGCLLSIWRQTIEIQAIAGQRADMICTALLDIRMKRVGVLDMFLNEIIFILLQRNIDPFTGDDPSLTERILFGMAERDKFILLFKVGELQLRAPPDGLESRFLRPGELINERLQFGNGGSPVKAADADIDGMDFPSADDVHDFVADFLEFQCVLDDGLMIPGHSDRIFVPEKIGSVQKINMEGMAFDPFTAIEETPEFAQLAIDRNSADTFHCMNGAHLVGNRADAANAGGNIGCLKKLPAAQEALKEAGRFKYFQLNVGDLPLMDLHIERPFAFNPGEIIDFYRSIFHVLLPPSGTVPPLH